MSRDGAGLEILIIVCEHASYADSAVAVIVNPLDTLPETEFKAKRVRDGREKGAGSRPDELCGCKFTTGVKLLIVDGFLVDCKSSLPAARSPLTHAPPSPRRRLP